MKKLATRRLKLIELQTASVEELLDARNKVEISNGSNWEMLCWNRDLLDRELSKRAKQDEIALHHLENETLIANS